LRAHFGPFFVSLGSLSPKQPNHGHFGTDVESSIIQRVAWHPKGVGFAKAPLRRSEPGSNHLVQCVCFRPQSRPVIRRLRPAGRDPEGTNWSPALVRECDAVFPSRHDLPGGAPSASHPVVAAPGRRTIIRQVSGTAVTVCALAVVVLFMHQVTDTTLLNAGPEPM
jgi:hypothetical protein